LHAPAAYFDTQLSRLGGPNFSSLPINRSVCPFISTIRDGHSQHRIPAGTSPLFSPSSGGRRTRRAPSRAGGVVLSKVRALTLPPSSPLLLSRATGPNYYPNRHQTPNTATPHGKGQNYEGEAQTADNLKPKEGVQTVAPYKVEGTRGRIRPARFNNHYEQAQLFWNSMSKVEQQHIIEAAQFELGRCDDRDVQIRNIMRWNDVDHDLAVAVAEAFDIDVPEPKIKNHGRKTDGQSPFSMLSPNNPGSATGRRFAIFALDGFDSLQVSGMVAAVTALGSIPNVIGSRKGPC